MPPRLPEWLEDRFWARHSNPKSGWSRAVTGPVLVCALYHRQWRPFLVGLAWTVLNPILFAPPERDDAWMTRAVLAERWWVREEHNGILGRSYPNLCNVASLIAALYTVFAALRRRPLRTALGTGLAIASKFWWLGAIVRRYDAAKRES
jgi:hypothetical protein